DGYFDQSPQSTESLAVIDLINGAKSDIVLIGFGAPKQEAWIHAHRGQINAGILFSCGACMEYVAGAVKTPPRWMGRTGLEWTFRLFENPRRFAFRYLVEPVLLGCILLYNGIGNLVRGKRA
ncbi:MAG: N-acetylglucosaminyldiphosphoundecaprenol N-acetyl-beta-D-mannosaminyltransferase, partial [Porticoccaceae bacterium]